MTEPSHERGSTEGDHDPLAHRKSEPRLFAFLWTLFLMSATMLTFLSVGPGGIGTRGVYRPAAKSLLLTILVGIMLLWPLVRLSQSRPRRGTPAMFQDWLVIVIPIQIVIWGQSILGGWSAERVLAIDAVLMAWAWLTGSLLAIALGRGGPRWSLAWMVVFLFIFALPLAAQSVWVSPLPALTPVRAIMELTSDEWLLIGLRPGRRHWIGIAALSVSSLVLWVFAWAWERGSGSDNVLD